MLWARDDFFALWAILSLSRHFVHAVRLVICGEMGRALCVLVNEHNARLKKVNPSTAIGFRRLQLHDNAESEVGLRILEQEKQAPAHII